VSISRHGGSPTRPARGCSSSNAAAPTKPFWRARIEARQTLNLPAHHTTTWEAVLAWLARTADADYPIDVPHLIVETAGPDDTTEQVLEWLRAQGIAPRHLD
jgi:hypothetical protein